MLIVGPLGHLVAPAVALLDTVLGPALRAIVGGI